MTDILEKTDVEIQALGIKALVEKLGISGALRFLSQFDRGSGNYTEERFRWQQEFTMDELIDEATRIQPPTH